MPAPKSIAPRKQWMQAVMEDNGAGLRKENQLSLPTIPTAAGTIVKDQRPFLYKCSDTAPACR